MARFVLNDLYGRREFARRDVQFARVVPGLVRQFPGERVATVAERGELHAQSESLDNSAARRLPRRPPGSAICSVSLSPALAPLPA